MQDRLDTPGESVQEQSPCVAVTTRQGSYKHWDPSVQEQSPCVAVTTSQGSYKHWDPSGQKLVLKQEQGFESSRVMELKTLSALEGNVKQEIKLHWEKGFIKEEATAVVKEQKRTETGSAIPTFPVEGNFLYCDTDPSKVKSESVSPGNEPLTYFDITKQSDRHVLAGNCNITCEKPGNCNITCEKPGNCNITCEKPGNCNITCEKPGSCNITCEKPGNSCLDVLGHVSTYQPEIDRTTKDTSSINCCCLPDSQYELYEREVDKDVIKRKEINNSRENVEKNQQAHIVGNTQNDSGMLHRSRENGTSFSNFILSSIQSSEIIGSGNPGEILHAVSTSEDKKRCSRGKSFKHDTRNVDLSSHSCVPLQLKTHMPGARYRCDDCGKILNYFSCLKRHIESHLEITGKEKCSDILNIVTRSEQKKRCRRGKSFKCDTCNIDLSSLSCVQSHLKFHMPGERYRCDDCGKKLNYFSCLKRHIESHLEKELCMSSDVDSGFSSESMKQKLKQNGGKCYRCDVCSVTLSSRSGLVSHKRKHMQDSNSKRKHMQGSNCNRKHMQEETYSSDIRRVDFPSKNAVLMRKPAHSGIYVCDLCGAMFTYRSNLLRHGKLHTKQKPFKCDICGLGFSYSCNMNEHRYTHTGEKPYSCHICSVAFSTKQNLLRHGRVHTKEKPYLCDICGVAFSWHWHLVEHKRTHTGEKPYKCDLCGVKFAAQGHLKKHRVIHTGERNYKCDTCGKTFARQTNLRSHERIHNRNAKRK